MRCNHCGLTRGTDAEYRDRTARIVRMRRRGESWGDVTARHDEAHGRRCWARDEDACRVTHQDLWP